MTKSSTPEIVLELLQLRSRIMRRADDDEEKQFGWDLVNLAADVAGVPIDNSVETGSCDWANNDEERRWPYWGYCRDALHEEILANEDNVERQRAIVFAWAEGKTDHIPYAD